MISYIKAVQKYITGCLCLALLMIPAIAKADCQITLNWDPNDTTPDGYRLYQRESGQEYNYNDCTDTGKSTAANITGLAEDTTYHFVVRAYLGSEESGDSNEATYTCTAGVTTNPPSQPYAVAPSDNSQDVNLEPTLKSSSFYDSDAGDYHTQTRWQVYRLDDDFCVYDSVSNSSLTSLTLPQSTLSPFTTYYWMVSYYDQRGSVSVPSQASDFTTLQTTEDGDESAEPTSSLSGSSSGSSSGGGSGGGGCFIQSLMGRR